MSLIDSTFFNGPITVPQLGQASVANNLDIFINRFEPRMLQAALGYQLYLDFLDGLSQDVPDQKWINIRDGVVFTGSGMWPPFYWQYPFLSMYRNWFIPQNPVRKMEWIGFANQANIYSSPIAGYVYYEYMRDQITQFTGVGVVNTQSENAATVSAATKMKDAFNQMSKDIFFLWQMLEADAHSGSQQYTSYERLKINYAFFQPVNQYNI